MCFSSPSPPPPPPPPPPRQVEKVPDYDVFRGKNRKAEASGIGAGPSGTLLTGTGGVADSKLLLQRKTLLGG